MYEDSQDRKIGLHLRDMTPDGTPLEPGMRVVSRCFIPKMIRDAFENTCGITAAFYLIMRTGNELRFHPEGTAYFRTFAR